MPISAKGLADKIGAIRQQYAHALQADLLALEKRFGRDAVAAAAALSQQQDLRASLSASGRRQRQHARGEDAREVAEAIFRKPEQE